ncbi:predicted protein [Scheffersomyces stipitis CBS 6054]|uniref:Cargo-transport protein YPP1 n=1 Tax=Scheffersomyces stipitis (strain ATCC 58785 / CBS 6054 / NBRC 10063 / NRRL Y-11545) TaxID=322104 RepID=A3LSY1_PICST|nr:predicted protein [Scheffersomyces stipitis CBS 6054]ABN66314.2 predicted protein [Scheffersomyces stipitis CBS 6054]
MFIENSINDKYLHTLNLGAFPLNVLEFQESQDFFQQLIFIDYQLQLLIQNEFNRNEFITAKSLELQGKTSPKEKLVSLINYVHSITLNYNNSTNSYDEKLYYSIIMAHLYYLNSQVTEMQQMLRSVPVAIKFQPSESQTKEQNDFIHYLSCRYHVLMGFTSAKNAYQIWLEYLYQFEVRFTKSEIAAQYWLDLMFVRLGNRLTDNGIAQLSFQGLKSHKFFDNKLAVIRFGSFLLRPEGRLVNSSFKTEFASFLAQDLEARLGNQTSFPDASNSNDELDNYVDNLYQSLSYLPNHKSLLKPSSSRKFLINSTAKSYQSQIILANYIFTLIELKEYDEAFAAFKTYINYLEKEQEQLGGLIENIMLVIDLYATCIISFNPLNSFANKSAESRFKYTTPSTVSAHLSKFIGQLHSYLNKLSAFVDMSFDVSDDDKNMPLSFLYRKYNINILQTDKSQFIQLVSKAWYAIGNYYYNLSVYNSANEEALKVNTENVLSNYKNSLIVNSTGSELYLFSYALALSNSNQLQASAKLCKFILKKYPESFKTWNLLVLLLSAFEANDPAAEMPAVPERLQSAPSPEADGTAADPSSNGFTSEHSIQVKKRSLTEPEKFVNNALNIAGLYVLKFKQKDIKLSPEIKYEILQLKLTQLAVWEQIHGVSYILEYLTEVFVLYHELFEVELEGGDFSNGHSNGRATTGNKWSHRPSVMDSSPAAAAKEAVSSSTKDRLLNVDRIKRISRLVPSKRQRHDASSTTSSSVKSNHLERRILQDLWLWTARIYLKIGLLEDCEQCIVEAETIYQPNNKTFTTLGYLTSKNRKFLALQEFERSLENFEKDDPYNRIDYGYSLLGLCKLFLIDDEKDNSLFISATDVNAGIIRMKNLLEKFSLSWPYGQNSPEVWHYLSKIYEIVDDKTLLTKSLWKCVELEDYRPVRSFAVCNDFNY